MISRDALDNLIIDYQAALAEVNDAARTLDDASVMASAVSPEFTRRSSRLIDDANQLYRDISDAIGALDAATPT